VIRIWRITTAAHEAFDGEGARRYGGRWTPSGFRAVYASATLSLAALERLVHADPDLEPPHLVALPIDLLDAMAIDTVDVDGLPSDWRTYPAPPALPRLGESWLRASRTAVLSVPSAVIPHERNYVLNPAHADAARLVIGKGEPFSLDPRLWKRSKRR
jgi:RES domain-containing protein